MSARPVTETMKFSDVKQGLNALVNRVHRRETRVLIAKSGIPMAAIVSARDLERLERLDRERAERFKILEEIGAAFKDVPFEELEREIARAIAGVRAARWTEGEGALREFAAGFADQTPEDVEREVAKAIAEVRAEKWAEREQAVGARK
jgi:prevent-host-death family protein